MIKLRVGATILALSAAGAVLAGPLTGQVTYPETKKGPVVDDYHGTLVADPYRWLEDTSAGDTEGWVNAQNSVTFDYLETLRDRETIRERLTQLWDYPKYGTPFKQGGLYFFSKNDGLQNQSVLYVQESLEAEPRVLLDPNTLSEDGTVALRAVAVSDDGRYLGYGTAASGSDWNEFHVRDVASGHDLSDRIRWVKFSGLSWTKDGEGFFYARYPEPVESELLLAKNADHRVYYHRVGTDQSVDVLVFEQADRPDQLYRAAVSDDGRYAFVVVSKGTDPDNLLYYIDLGDPGAPNVSAPIVRLIDAYEASFRPVGNTGSTIYVQTNLDAPKQRVISIDLNRPARSNWRTVIPESEDVLRSVQIIGGRMIATYLKDARSDVRIFGLDGRPQGELPLPGIGSVGGMSGKVGESEMFYSFTSFLYPTTIFRYDLDTGHNEVFRAPDVDFDPQAYETKQIFYRSKDGTSVPMFITHRKGIPMDGSNPAYLYGYGGFDISQTPRFSVTNLVWLEMGGVYAMPNLRGGGEYGEAWHLAGTKERKQNVFDDFIAAAEYLIDEGYTSSEKLSIGGGSNGGLLVGATMVQRPDLAAVAHPAVGVMDMLRFHKFTIGWAWVSDYGSSDNPEDFEYLKAYSPLHNLKPGTCYPATLVTTADHDDRVVPGHSFKFAATLQAAQGCDNPTLIRIESKAGHGAGKPTSKRIEEAVDILSFRVKHLGMERIVM